MTTTLGKFTLHETLGSGATATVYKAEDTELGRLVALKVLSPALSADPDALARFRLEARALASLVHPHIAWLWEMGESDGRVFLATRFADGLPLDRRLVEKGPIPWAEALACVEQVAGALDWAHARGLVHRDVKPANIILSTKEGAVLTDFGLVKALYGAGTTNPAGDILGTPAYIAPEVWLGQPVGPAADQYALACVLVQMLSGQVLFPGETPPAVMTRHVRNEPAWPATWPAGVPTGLLDVISRALMPRPDQRYESATSFWDALRGLRTSRGGAGLGLPDDYPNQREGPAGTTFPPVARNYWRAELLETANILGQPLTPGAVFWTPPILLEAGEYAIKLVNEDGQTPRAWPVYVAKPGVMHLGDLGTGKLGPQTTVSHALRLHLQSRTEAMRLGVAAHSRQGAAHPGLLLIPRLGRLWRGDEIARFEGEAAVGQTTPQGERRITRTGWQPGLLACGPNRAVEPGIHMAIVRLGANLHVTDKADAVVRIELWCQVANRPAQLLTSREVSLDWLLAGGFCDIGMPFVIDDPPAHTPRHIVVKVWTNNPTDLTVSHIRVCTPAERMWERYFELGGIDSGLGAPLGAVFAAAASQAETRGLLLRFEGGTLYWADRSDNPEVYEVYGPIGRRFEEKNGTGGWQFGFPTTRPQAVASSYGSGGEMQQFENFAGKAIVYAWRWPNQTTAFEVIGGIASTFAELQRHDGPLGFPTSGEYTVFESHERWVRRSDFEGGFIEWEAGPDRIWKHLRTEFYVRPRVQSLTWTPENAYAGHPLTVRLEAENLGTQAEHGWLTLSFPDALAEPPMAKSDVGSAYVSGVGEPTHWKYGHPGHTLSHPRVELWVEQWTSQVRHWLEVTVIPVYAGLFRIQARATAGPISKYDALRIHAEGDPLPLSEAQLDQQQERVYEHTLTVRERLLPAFAFEATSLPALIEGRVYPLPFRIRNVGSGIARQIRVSLPQRFGAGVSDVLAELAPGQALTLEVDAIPSQLGWARLDFELEYCDQYTSEVQRNVYKARLQVVGRDEPRPAFVFLGQGDGEIASRL